MDFAQQEDDVSHFIEEHPNEDEIINLQINFSTWQFRIIACNDVKFQNIVEQVCELAGWDPCNMRFILDGERLQNGLTLSENALYCNAIVDVFEELRGGKGGNPSDEAIRNMLDKYDSEADNDDDATDAANETDDVDQSNKMDTSDDNYNWYEDLKLQLKDGRLKLNRSHDLEKKLLFLLETESLQPYEMIRLRNIYSIWEHSLSLKDDSESSKSIPKANEGNTDNTMKTIDGENKLKRTTSDSYQDSHSHDDGTPNKRRLVLETVGLTSPSPLIKSSKVTEMDMKRLSVSVHLWAGRKMGGVQFLQMTRLTDAHFEDILTFAGPESKWKLMKGRTVRQVKSMWRNTYGGKHYHRGHQKTGFENEFQRHISSKEFCPFGHCSDGIMSPMDLDLIVLTPRKSLATGNEKKKEFSSRKLFDDNALSIDEDKGDSSDMIIGVTSEDITEEVLPFKPVNPVVTFSQQVDTKSSQQAERTSGQHKGTGHQGDTFQFVDAKSAHSFCETNESEHHINSKVSNESNNGTVTKETNFVCECCDKSFHTFFGYERHYADKHSEVKVDKVWSHCPFCEKKVIYLDQHLRTKHSSMQKPSECEVCLQHISCSMLKHRKVCIKCRYCEYKNLKKARLLKHIENCTKNPGENIEQPTEPLDLRSPLKRVAVNENQNSELESTLFTKVVKEKDLPPVTTANVLKTTDNIKEIATQSMNCDVGKEDLEKGRPRYPFDQESTDEDYYSEIDVDDEDQFTIARRLNKDVIEVKLREVDALINTEIEGDNIIVEKFTEFMRSKRHKESKEEGYSRQAEPSTITMYAKVVRNDILPSFHKLISPFDSRWLIDCVTPKHCRFDGEERLHVALEEPIYMTSRILLEAVKNTRTQKKRVISAFNQLMDFIELQFTLKLNAYGVDVLKKVLTYHKGVKSFIKATSQWKNSKDEENESYETNKLLKDYQNPNKDIEVLEKYKEYIKSDERAQKINQLLSFAYPEHDKPSEALMTQFGVTVMEEIIACTGCRPKVARHLTMGAFIDAKPGFNPYDSNGDDSTIDEEIDGAQIRRRVNPNLPPKERACAHQLEHKSAQCPENCEKECMPEGYNFWITWDKTQSSKGPYFLHIPTPIKNLMDRYDVVRSNYFKGRDPKFGIDKFWLEDKNTPLFLNSACNTFPSLDLKRLSKILGVDVTAYSFRRIVSTWALTHKSGEIRAAEEEALQHSNHVAKERYIQNKQTIPQNLVQTYTQEENLFPKKFTDQFGENHSDIDLFIGERQKNREEARYSNLLKQKEMTKKERFETRPLGPRNTILDCDRKEFFELIEKVTGRRLETVLTCLKPVKWRDFIVRAVCSYDGGNRERLRELWIKVYKGDLLHGVSDERRRAKDLNWPSRKQNPGRRDRNSWISHALRKSCLGAQKGGDKKK